MAKISTHEDLIVFKRSFELALKIFESSKSFPKEERWALTDQIRRSSRSVCANIAEAYRKRKYPKFFVSCIITAEAEAAETQVWIKFCQAFSYLNQHEADSMLTGYDEVISMLVAMRNRSDKWSFYHKI
jgi:four helix bundle protein